jgi:putative membrane protein
LRALSVPAGKHEIRFAFEPQIVKTGSSLSLVGAILLIVWLIGGIVLQVRKPKLAD